MLLTDLLLRQVLDGFPRLVELGRHRLQRRRTLLQALQQSMNAT